MGVPIRLILSLRQVVLVGWLLGPAPVQRLAAISSRCSEITLLADLNTVLMDSENSFSLSSLYPIKSTRPIISQHYPLPSSMHVWTRIAALVVVKQRNWDTSFGIEIRVQLPFSYVPTECAIPMRVCILFLGWHWTFQLALIGSMSVISLMSNSHKKRRTFNVHPSFHGEGDEGDVLLFAKFIPVSI